MIYKAPSIYKQGGGGSGGGYKDGGELVDGDYIKVENNSISTYTNTSRTDLNYYFEIQNGDVLNSVIELTNEYNATVHIYILQNGFFIPLGNVGGDTVNAGDDYKINIVGNSFMLEVVTPSQADPEAAIIDGQIYGLKKIGSVLWTTSNVSLNLYNPNIYNGDYYYNYFNAYDGWRIPNDNDVNALLGTYTVSELKSVSGWLGGGGNGTNASGMNFQPKGYWNIYINRPTLVGNSAEFLYLSIDNQVNRFTIASSFVKSGYDPAPVRLVRDV